jgi:hypothetical protein
MVEAGPGGKGIVGRPSPRRTVPALVAGRRDFG